MLVLPSQNLSDKKGDNYMATKQKILIVDDDNNIAELISLYLTKECFDTKIVNDGEEALTAFEQYNPNLILLDLMLPGIDGYRSAGMVRSQSKCSNYHALRKGRDLRQGIRT